MIFEKVEQFNSISVNYNFRTWKELKFIVVLKETNDAFAFDVTLQIVGNWFSDVEESEFCDCGALLEFLN